MNLPTAAESHALAEKSVHEVVESDLKEIVKRINEAVKRGGFYIFYKFPASVTARDILIEQLTSAGYVVSAPEVGSHRISWETTNGSVRH